MCKSALKRSAVSSAENSPASAESLSQKSANIDDSDRASGRPRTLACKKLYGTSALNTMDFNTINTSSTNAQNNNNVEFSILPNDDLYDYEDDECTAESAECASAFDNDESSADEYEHYYGDFNYLKNHCNGSEIDNCAGVDTVVENSSVRDSTSTFTNAIAQSGGVLMYDYQTEQNSAMREDIAHCSTSRDNFEINSTIASTQAPKSAVSNFLHKAKGQILSMTLGPQQRQNLYQRINYLPQVDNSTKNSPLPSITQAFSKEKMPNQNVPQGGNFQQNLLKGQICTPAVVSKTPNFQQNLPKTAQNRSMPNSSSLDILATAAIENKIDMENYHSNFAPVKNPQSRFAGKMYNALHKAVYRKNLLARQMISSNNVSKIQHSSNDGIVRNSTQIVTIPQANSSLKFIPAQNRDRHPLRENSMQIPQVDLNNNNNYVINGNNSNLNFAHAQQYRIMPVIQQQISNVWRPW